MDALILRVALLLSLAPSVVARLSATEVLATAYAETQRQQAKAAIRDLMAVRTAQYTALAFHAPENLAQEERRIRDAAGLTPAPTPLPPALEAQLAALPLEG